MQTDALSAAATATDTFPINGTDYVEFYVGNAKQASHFYRTAFGFQLVAYRGPETGVRDRASYLLQQDKIRFVLTTPLRPDHPAAEHVHKHGDGVRDIALWVDDAREAFRNAVERGAEPVQEPTVLRDDDGEVVIAGDPDLRRHDPHAGRAVELRGPLPARLPPGRRRATGRRQSGSSTSTTCVGNVELGQMNEWVGFYERRMGFKNLITFDDKDISTEYSSLMSKVMSNGNERIKFPINEPAAGQARSRRSTSTSSSTAAPACSTSRSRPTTSSRRSRRCATAASSS